jgi:hypothetical protein
METKELEERFRIANLARKVLEQKRNGNQQEITATPGSTREALEKLQNTKKIFDTVLVGEAFQQITNLMKPYKNC